ncbi:hypothetical protein AZC_3578 [Azorhizobium caulinodans ORS 571]|uniref:Uncharacterized protein n=1 Tax=Azorhizobium caulinodans (strain ATCC 43989 / DSM 5975 / JCM 20966 / LMG 6465 / NBRC 14845 / NCIMB 13405 / ORS 571) TaxID=438753 RepID=A8IF54_AZOC5|nr:hypothetical protein [Azorhizobium caulinodans]BAF89576.1 hypothetical protein AZC_3578 [Azorhizobium caulinodans ORS 571]
MKPIADLGVWEVYKPDLPADDPRPALRVAFFRNAEGDDWYEAVAHNPNTPQSLTVACNPQTMVVEFVGEQPDMIDPNKRRVFILDAQMSNEDARQLLGKVYDPRTGTFSDPVLTDEEQRRLRQIAYQAEADPLFFEWQRGEATEEQYRAKLAEIRARYPLSTD